MEIPMSELSKAVIAARCACGGVEFEATGAPIVSVVCYCDDCQEAGRRIEALPNAPPVRDEDGGTAYLVYRKDRVKCSRGAQLLQRIKIKDKSPTNRVVAGCCNSAMILNFDDAKHWVDVYRARVAGDAPPLQMRVCTRFSSGDVPRDVPGYPSFPLGFLAKLLAAKIAMLLHR
jgi:hypothetical protein